MSTVLKQDLTVTILFQSDPKPVCLTKTEISTFLFPKTNRETYVGDLFLVQFKQHILVDKNIKYLMMIQFFQFT
jgi:hypothetical protein